MLGAALAVVLLPGVALVEAFSRTRPDRPFPNPEREETLGSSRPFEADEPPF